MKTYSELNRNWDVIRRFTEEWRIELTTFAGVMAEKNGICSAQDYIRFMNERSMEEFSMNYATAMFIDHAVDDYIEILNGKLKIVDFFARYCDEETLREYINTQEV